jgi:hypothetical protein
MMAFVCWRSGKAALCDFSPAISSTILGFNIFLVPAERSAKDIDDVITLAARKGYRAVVDKTFPMSEVA